MSKWLAELKEHVNGNVVVSLVGNKNDLRHLRAVSREDAQSFADLSKMNFIETSALDAGNIETAFSHIIEGLIFVF